MPNPITSLALQLSARARSRRAEYFRSQFHIDRTTRILDIGSEDGSNINKVLAGSEYTPSNVVIVDLYRAGLKEGHDRYGYLGVGIGETGFLPFSDRSFDIVYCSSVIEHVTVPRAKLWQYRSGRRFWNEAWEHQKAFANEIRRVGRQYFVQTPNLGFPIESHTWLPAVGYLPRRLLLPVLSITNKVWVRASEPDFNLLNAGHMKELFPDAAIKREKIAGLTKSLMAIRSDGRA
jgi:SAM-dependent methyltransferase